MSYQKWSCLKIYCKCKIFLTSVYMIFQYSKRFRFAPSFNNPVFTPLYIMYFVKEFEKKALFAFRREEDSQKQFLCKHGNFRFFLTTKMLGELGKNYSFPWNSTFEKGLLSDKDSGKIGLCTLFLTNKPMSISHAKFGAHLKKSMRSFTLWTSWATDRTFSKVVF